MTELLLPIGLQASGKSTFSKGWVLEDPDARIRASWDDARLARYGKDWVWNRRDEEEMKTAVKGIVIAALKAGISVVVDNTNLSANVRKGWENLARSLGASYMEHDISTPIDVCVQRDRGRGDARVGQAVIDGTALQYGLLDWDGCTCARGERIHSDMACREPKPIIIVDIDSTIADDNGRLGHLDPMTRHAPDCNALAEDGLVKSADLVDFSDGSRCRVCNRRPSKDWGAYFAAVSDDTPIPQMVHLLERLSDHLIVLISGRPVSNGATKVGILTEDWLLKHNIHFDRLFLKMRDFHQRSPDFKKGILEYLPKDRVKYVFDDDPLCAEMYRREGLYVLQPFHKGRG